MRVVVVGGGLAGLFTASELVGAGVEDVVVVEKTDRPGGVARTIEQDGFSLEPAAGSFNLPHPHLGPILERAGVEVMTAAATSRYVYTDGRLVHVPPSPKALFAPLVSVPAKLRALAEPAVRRAPGGRDETLSEFCRRRFGGQAGEMLGWLMASGVFAGDPERLSAASAFPTLTALEQGNGSVVRGALRRRRDRPPDSPTPRAHLPVGGMAGLTATIAGSLGGRFLGGFPVETVRPDRGRWVVAGPETLTADAVVMATHPHQTARMLGGELRAHLNRAVSAPVVVVALGGTGPAPAPPGFGALVGRDAGLITRGVLFESSYAPDRAPNGSWLLKVIAGGAPHPEDVEWDDDRLVARMTAEAALIIGADLAPGFVEVVRHLPGIPQYERGHGEWLATLDGLTRDRPGLYPTGWGYRGVGVGHLATEAARVAREIEG